jgi:hypothetical protein
MKNTIRKKPQEVALKPAYAVYGARIRQSYSEKMQKWYRKKAKWQVVYDDLGSGDCCCYEPERAYYIFKTRKEADAKAEYLTGYDDVEVRRVGIAMLPSKKDTR